MRYLQYGQIKTTNRQFQTFRDLNKNHKTFCDVFSNRFASVLQPLTQNEM